ncbi:MAG: HAMP domain-containing histidine kinase [Alphaproteobacteria bacterium]|nr:HAMP domain-containing histidine kinase [Alphaproteobacteria bacterium]
MFGYVYWSTAAYVRGRADHAIEAERAILRQAFAEGGRSGLIVAIERRISDKRFEGAHYLLTDAQFAPRAGNLAAWPESLRTATGWHNLGGQEWKPDATDAPVLRAFAETLADGSHLLVATAIGDLDVFTRRIATALICGGLLLLVIAGVASVSVTRRTVGRIESINTTSRAIMQSGLGERIPLRGTRDEWDQVAENLNQMLDRIELLMDEVKQVTDNVAHDLRTPLARMRGRLEKAYVQSRASKADQELIADTIADLDAVLRIFASLTRISQIEASGRKVAFRPVDLAEIAGKVVELFDAAVEERGGRLTLTADGPAVITGDRDLLFDALANLVDNAIKHGHAGGRVGVAIARTAAAATVTITDDGPGIPPEEHGHVFKRFYRLERSRQTPGNGLGLSLVAAVARLHQAEVELIDNAPGLTVRLSFPIAREAETTGPSPREAVAQS